MKSYSSPPPEDVEPVQFELNGEVFTVAPQPVGRILSVQLRLRQGDKDYERLAREILVWLGRGLSSEHETYRDQPGHIDAADNPVEGCQGCRIEVMLSEGLKPELLMQIAGDVMNEMSSRPPTKSTS